MQRQVDGLDNEIESFSMEDDDIKSIELKIEMKINFLFSKFVKYPDHTTYQGAKLKLYEDLVNVMLSFMRGLVSDISYSENEKIRLLKFALNKFQAKCELFINNPELIYFKVETVGLSLIPLVDPFRGFIRANHEKSFFKEMSRFFKKNINFFKKIIFLNKELELLDLNINELKENIYSVIMLCIELKLEYRRIKKVNFPDFEDANINFFEEGFFISLLSNASGSILSKARMLSHSLMRTGQSLDGKMLSKISSDLALMVRTLCIDLSKIRVLEDDIAAITKESCFIFLVPSSLANALYVHRKHKETINFPFDLIMIYNRLLSRVIASQKFNNYSQIDLYALFGMAVKDGLLINDVVSLYEDWLGKIDVNSLTLYQFNNIKRSEVLLKRLGAMVNSAIVHYNFGVDAHLSHIFSDFSEAVYASPQFMQLQKMPTPSLSGHCADLFAYANYTPFKESALYRIIQMLINCPEMTGQSWLEKVKEMRSNVIVYLDQLRNELKFCLPYYLNQFVTDIRCHNPDMHVLYTKCTNENVFKKLRLVFHPDHCDFAEAGEILTEIQSWLEKVDDTVNQMPDDPIILRERNEVIKKFLVEERQFMDEMIKQTEDLERQILEMNEELQTLRSASLEAKASLSPDTQQSTPHEYIKYTI